jgi:hypothetical protein
MKVRGRELDKRFVVFVIPAKAGIQYLNRVLDTGACPRLRSGVRRYDGGERADFVDSHAELMNKSEHTAGRASSATHKSSEVIV